MKRIRKGFTLIELLIVIAIIGILASVAIPQMLKARTKAKCSGVEKNYTSIVGELANELDSVERGAKIPCANATCQQGVDNVIYRHSGGITTGAGCATTYLDLFCNGATSNLGNEPDPFDTADCGIANGTLPVFPGTAQDGTVYLDCNDATNGANCALPSSCAVVAGYSVGWEPACGYSAEKRSLVTTKD